MLDLGCGTGFHLPRWAASAPVRCTASSRTPGWRRSPPVVRRDGRNVTVLPGTAQQVPLPDASVDVVQARWAYFFGPGCEPGLRELDRVMRRGGTAFVVDNDTSRSTFGGWFRRGYPMIDADEVQAFWSRHGWQRRPLDIAVALRDARRPGGVRAHRARRARWPTRRWPGHEGTEVDYAVDLWWRRY